MTGGATWSAVPLPARAGRVFVDGHLAGRLYAVAHDAVLVSGDGGRTWKEFVVEGVAGDVRSHPADPGRTYAWVYSGENPVLLWRLDESGAKALGSSPVPHPSFPPVPDPWTPGGFYVAAWGSLHHTSDEGRTWRGMALDAASGIVGLLPSDSEPGLLYAHSWTFLFRSQDGGETWQRTGARFPGLDHGESLSAAGPGVLLIQTSGGAYLSTDRGETAVPATVEEVRPPVGTLWFDNLRRLNMATMLSREGETYLGLYRKDGGNLAVAGELQNLPLREPALRGRLPEPLGRRGY